jgi:predicted  nucleic acid-binding Zn-ribbon protein
MAYQTCPDCGERVYRLGCTNCNESAYIEAQEGYGDPLPMTDRGRQAKAEAPPVPAASGAGGRVMVMEKDQGLPGNPGREEPPGGQRERMATD